MKSEIISKVKSDKILTELAKIMPENGEIFTVGGTVRDFALGKDIFDRDIIVTGISAENFAKIVKEHFGGTFITLDYENKIYRVVLKDKLNFIDIVEPLENSIEKDILRRDLTINSIAVNLKTYEIIDLTGGFEDLEHGTIRATDGQNFLDDPLRLLRVFRFQSLTGFDIDKTTAELVKKYADLIKKPSKERVNYELMKLFSGKYSYDALKSMDFCGILEIIFPFVKELKSVPPNSHHHLNLFNHSLEVVNRIQQLYEADSKEVRKHLECVDFGGFSRLAHLKFAGFLHDIGKFSTWTIESDTGRHRFINHDNVGADMAVPILKSLKFSKKQIEYISSMIKHHIYPSSVMSAPEITEKIMMRYIRRMGENSVDEIILAKADRLSARGIEITDEIVKKNLDSLDRLKDFYIQIKDTLKPLEILLDGNDVMKLLNLKPSPELGKILNLLHEEQLNGNVNTREQAVNFVLTLDFDNL